MDLGVGVPQVAPVPPADPRDDGVHVDGLLGGEGLLELHEVLTEADAVAGPALAGRLGVVGGDGLGGLLEWRPRPEVVGGLLDPGPEALPLLPRPVESEGVPAGF